MTKLSLTLLLILNFCFALAQNAGLYNATGKVLDATTGQPVPYASLRTGDDGAGTITNNEGGFSINLPRDAQNSVKVSCIGYVSAKVNFFNNGKPVLIKLTRSMAMLKDVVITTESPAQIVAHAYRNIPKNYPLSNTLYTGFYRESTLQKSGDSAEVYNYIIEAVIKHNKPSYLKSKPEGNIKIENSRISVFRTDIGQFWKAGAYTPIRFDVAKVRPDFIDPLKQKRYIYNREDNTTYYDEPVFVISFKPRKKAYYEGLLYINTRTYAIVKVDYELTDHGLSDDPDVYGGASGLVNRQYKTNYQPIGNKWYLQSIWQQASGDEHNKLYRYVTEFAATKVDRDSTLSLDYAERLQYNEILSLKPSPYNAGFWKDYNIVAETEKLKDLLIDTTIAIKPAAPSDKKLDEVVAKLNPANEAKFKAKQQSLQKISAGLNRLRPVFIIPGVTILQNSATNINVSYTNAQGTNIVNQAVPIKANAAVAGIGIGVEYDIVKNLEVHYMGYTAYGKYNNTALDLGAGFRKQISPANKRPVYFMLAANYSINTINQQLNQYQNNGAPVAVGDKTFEHDIRPTLFSRQHSIKPQIGFSIEISKLLNVYAQTGYNLYLNQTDAIKFVSHSGIFFKDLFPRRQEVSATAPGVNLLVDDKPNQHLPYRANWFFNIGFKGFVSFRK